MTKVHPAAAWEYCIYVYNDQDFGYFDQNGKKYERPNTMSVRYLNSGANGKIQIKLSNAVLGKTHRVRYTVVTTIPGFVNEDRRRNQRSRAVDVYPGGVSTMDNSGEISGYAYGTVSDEPSFMGSGGGTHYKATHKYWYNDMGRQINEQLAWGTVIIDQYYGYGYGLLFRKQGNTGSHEYLHTDALGSVTAITDQDGNTVGTYDYDPYGELMTSSENLGNFGFTGQEVDWETELYHFPARYYEPRWGRFVTPDPWTGMPDDERNLIVQSYNTMNKVYPQVLNMYLYVKNNPVNYVDPLGLSEKGDCKTPDACYNRCITARSFYYDPNISPAYLLAQAGLYAGQYWAERSIDPTNDIGKKVWFTTMGLFASLWTPSTFNFTSSILFLSYGARNSCRTWCMDDGSVGTTTIDYGNAFRVEIHNIGKGANNAPRWHIDSKPFGLRHWPYNF